VACRAEGGRTPGVMEGVGVVCRAERRDISVSDGPEFDKFSAGLRLEGVEVGEAELLRDALDFKRAFSVLVGGFLDPATEVAATAGTLLASGPELSSSCFLPLALTVLAPFVFLDFSWLLTFLLPVSIIFVPPAFPLLPVILPLPVPLLPPAEVTEALLSTDNKLISDLSDFVDESVSRLLLLESSP